MEVQNSIENKDFSMARQVTNWAKAQDQEMQGERCMQVVWEEERCGASTLFMWHDRVHLGIPEWSHRLEGVSQSLYRFWRKIGFLEDLGVNYQTGLACFAGIAWGLWDTRNKIYIRKILPTNPIDVVHLYLSYVQRWKILMRKLASARMKAMPFLCTEMEDFMRKLASARMKAMSQKVLRHMKA
jgi:hypothetical protein